MKRTRKYAQSATGKPWARDARNAALRYAHSAFRHRAVFVRNTRARTIDRIIKVVERRAK
jgi:hypothetical protein